MNLGLLLRLIEATVGRVRSLTTLCYTILMNHGGTLFPDQNTERTSVETRTIEIVHQGFQSKRISYFLASGYSKKLVDSSLLCVPKRRIIF